MEHEPGCIGRHGGRWLNVCHIAGWQWMDRDGSGYPLTRAFATRAEAKAAVEGLPWIIERGYIAHHFAKVAA